MMGLEIKKNAKKPLEKVGNFYKHAFISRELKTSSWPSQTGYKYNSVLGNLAIFPLHAFKKADKTFKNKKTSKLGKFTIFMGMLLATPPLIVGFAVTLMLAIIAAVALAAAAAVVVPVAGLVQLGQHIKEGCSKKEASFFSKDRLALGSDNNNNNNDTFTLN